MPGDRAVAPYVPLPGEGARDAHAVREEARTVFDRVADAYDRSRPGYPRAVFDDLVSHGLTAASRVLEVGCGTGQATIALAEMTREVFYVELGPELAHRARQNLASCDNVRVLTGAFEEVELPHEGFDAVFSATAFHWIDPAVAYLRAAALLRPGGVLALVTNAHVAGGSQVEILEDVAALQTEICPEMGRWRFPSAADVTHRATTPGDIAHVWARVERSFHEPPDVTALFRAPFVATHEWIATYDRDGYLDMLGTQSSYAALDGARRARLFDGIGDLIDRRLAGSVTKTYLAVVAVAETVDSAKA